jgi:hypothetical protein
LDRDSSIFAYASAPSSAFPLKITNLFKGGSFNGEGILNRVKRSQKRWLGRENSSFDSLTYNVDNSDEQSLSEGVDNFDTYDLSEIKSLVEDLERTYQCNVYVYTHRARAGRVGIFNLKNYPPSPSSFSSSLSLSSGQGNSFVKPLYFPSRPVLVHNMRMNHNGTMLFVYFFFFIIFIFV